MWHYYFGEDNEGSCLCSSIFTLIVKTMIWFSFYRPKTGRSHTDVAKGLAPYHCLALGEIVWVLLQVLEIANGFSIGNPQFLPLFALFRGWKKPAWLPVSMCMHGRGIICLFVRI